MLARFLFRHFSEPISQSVSLFESLKFPPFIRRIFDQKEFVEPTPIQTQVWPHALDGKDVIGIAQTGSGKTYAYAVPSIMNITKSVENNFSVQRHQGPLCVILLPTRELCKQVHAEYCRFAYSIGIRVAMISGGESRNRQITACIGGVHTVIGTPGRIMDLHAGEFLDLSKVNNLILDEADHMLDMGFEDQIRNIVYNMPKNRQTLMFTATWPEKIQNLASEFLIDPLKITIGDTDLTMNEDIEHQFIYAPDDTKSKHILSLINENDKNKFLIFVNRKSEAELLKQFLIENDVKCDTLHSDRDQMIRSMVISNFRTKKLMVLIATDVASRGLDIKGIDAVVNYDFPKNFDDYIHRVGRTARAGAKGLAISFINFESHAFTMKKLKKSLELINQPVPSFFDDIIGASNDQPRKRR
ncbi:hypothetical protein SteCoe_33491 [Stentor coeruleus]|uniref:RNA helicase n=1 Tax=Stentor coeruleus TaxID=5963 RepID=A0A1R2AWN6_9CILI|nr:hypothetical protein SteCoe_33491 [Stentor coeruleus]